MRRFFLLPLLLLVLPRPAFAQCTRGLEIPESIITNTGIETKATWSDLDGDGKLDALVFNNGSGTVLMNRNGVFVPLPTVYEAFARVYDQTRDGRPDLISTPSPSRLRVQPGNGDGTFGPAVETELAPFGLTERTSLTDFDHDGQLDVVYVGYDAVRFVRGSGNTFVEVATRGMSRRADFATPVVGDFDGDGHVDVMTVYAVTFQHQRTLTFFWSDANYELTSTSEIFDGNDLPTTLYAVDLEGDGTDEILGLSTQDLYVVRGKNRKATIERTPFLNFTFDNQLPILGAADVDADGHRDLILGGGPVYIARGTSSGKFEPPVTLSLGGGQCASLLDFNGDGVQDIVGSCGTPGMTVLLGGSNFFRNPQIFRTQGPHLDMYQGDLNGDRVPDLLITYYGSSLELMAGRADGTFQPEWVYRMPEGVFTKERVVADFDGDGLDDVAVSASTGTSVIFGSATNFGGSVLKVDAEKVVGSGRLDGKTVLVTRSKGMLQSVAIAADRSAATVTPFYAIDDSLYAFVLEADGDADFEVVVSKDSETRIVNREGSGWTAGAPLPFRGLVWSGTSRDVNADGRPDLGLWGSVELVLLSDGSGYRPMSLYSGGSSKSISFADFDNDGLPDVELVTTEVIRVLRNLGGNTFTSVLGVPSADLYYGAAVYDADGDGWNDVVGIGGIGVRVIRNVCSPLPLRVTTTPAIVHAGESATINIHALTPISSFTGLITILEGSSVVYQKQPNSAAYGTAAWKTPALAAGMHRYTITYKDALMGSLETHVDLSVDVPVPRRRSTRH